MKRRKSREPRLNEELLSEGFWEWKGPLLLLMLEGRQVVVRCWSETFQCSTEGGARWGHWFGTGLWPCWFGHLIIKPFWSCTSMYKHCTNIFRGNNKIPETIRNRGFISSSPFSLSVFRPDPSKCLSCLMFLCYPTTLNLYINHLFLRPHLHWATPCPTLDLKTRRLRKG